MVICFAGQMQNGKSEAAKILCNNSTGWQLTSFAKPVKEIYCKAFGVDLDFVNKWKNNKDCPPGFKKTVRKGLQYIGDGFRQIHPDCWVNYAFNNNTNESFCLDDGRYINELKNVHQRGGVNVLVWRPGFENDDPNGSEAEIKPLINWFAAQGLRGDVMSVDKSKAPYGAEFIHYFLVNDGNKDELLENVMDFLKPFLLKYF